MPEISMGPDAVHSKNSSVKVLVSDDSEIVRRGIRQLLSAHTEIEIVGEAANYAQTIQLLCDLHPEVVVLDLHMPDEKNHTPQEVKSHLNHGSHLLAISFLNDEETAKLANRFGAVTFLDKTNLANTLIPTIVRLCQKNGNSTKFVAGKRCPAARKEIV
jgi:DNA-binding NarL/FixJ family response regulator